MAQAFSFPSNADPGDETRRFGDYIGAETAEEVYTGEAVQVNGSGQVEQHATGGTQVLGVAYAGNDAPDNTASISSGNQCTVKTHGVMVALVTSNVSVGGTAGTDAGGDADHSAGDLSSDGDEYFVLATGSLTNPRSGSSDDYGLVLKL